jgi:outer membrane protein OmpA-like peptidoglycan-associated protein
MARTKGMLALLPLAVTLLALTAPPALAAGDYPNEVDILAGISMPDKDLLSPEVNQSWGLVGAARYTRFFGDHWGGFLDFTSASYDCGTEVPNVWTRVWRGGAEWSSMPKKNKNWSVTFGAGWEELLPSYGAIYDRSFVSLGFGQRIATTGKGVWRWEIRGDQTVDDGGSNDGAGGKSLLNIHAMLGLGFGFGGTPKDTDGDGVVDRKDKCPNTPMGAIVDASGCPLDGDGDGVYNGIDRCADTPKGVKVDASGCPLDSDADLVADYLDKCPSTPRGVKVDKDGCPVDSDGDSVPDYLDKCPGTPKGVKVDRDGCPPDSDGDGVSDYLDKCPNTARGEKVDSSGCPLSPPPPVHTTAPVFKEGKSLVLEGVNFEYNSSKLTVESRAVLDRVAASLVDWSDVNVEVDGHTDGRGADAFNLKLSQARAESVRDYLVSKGVAASRLAAKGFGETRPIADNKTDEGRAKNRRVELTKTN